MVKIVNEKRDEMLLRFVKVMNSSGQSMPQWVTNLQTVIQVEEVQQAALAVRRGGAQEARRAVQRRDLQNDVIYSPFMIGVQGHSQSIRVLPHQIIYTLSREPGKE